VRENREQSCKPLVGVESALAPLVLVGIFRLAVGEMTEASFPAPFLPLGAIAYYVKRLGY